MRVDLSAPEPGELRALATPSLLVLLAANVIPLVGVVALGWDLGLILLLYWAESAVILAFSLLKLALTAGKAAFALVPFFLVHAGMFMGGHLLFLLVLFVDRPAAGWSGLLRDLGIGLAVFAASHLYSFVANFRRKGESYAKAQDVMGGFYARIVVMHLTIIGGAFLIAFLGSNLFTLGLLVGLKTVVDGFAHLRERSKHVPARPSEAPPTPPTDS